MQQIVRSLSCTCGQTTFEVQGNPILSVECVCDSCRKAAEVLEALPGAPALADEKGATRCEMYRKDRVRCVSGNSMLREYRLTPKTKTRRVVATCCNTPMFMEFPQGHWVDLYGARFPADALPPLDMRTMAGDWPAGTALPDDVPNAKTHSMRFYLKLVAAWAAMGFRSPKIDYVNGALDVP